MKRIFSTMTGGLMAAALIFSSCSDQIQDEIVASNPQENVPSEVVAKLQKLGFNTDGIKMDGNSFLVEGDMIITPAALAEMGEGISVPGIAGEEQYRTYNLVNNNRTIKVRGSNLSSNLSTGLDWAIANYNALNIGLTFTRVSSGENILVRTSGTSAGGSAGFPSGGNPYPTVNIGSGTSNYGTNVCEHVITHEIGHCLGLRHTDYFNRAYSCGSGGNEGASTVGAVHIPGTPTGYDSGSIMNSCFSGSATGEFSYYDRVALEYLY